MPFKFRHLCDLLQALDDNRIKKKVTSTRARNTDTPIIISWFNKHDRQISRHSASAVAFLSCLFPKRRADRVYNVQEKRLEKIIGRILMLGTTRMRHLSSWRTANGSDFARTVQNVMSEAEFDRPRPEDEVTLEEIDVLFDRIAATYSGSSPDLRMRIIEPIAADEALSCLLPRLQGIEAKWLVRMFLKRYTPVDLPERLIMSQFHCLLPEIMCLQTCFMAAVACLEGPAISQMCARPLSKVHEQAIKIMAVPHLKPRIGIMIQRPSYHKARSMQHCCDMAARKRISVERKYDGEYCQVHVDMSKGKESIKIFSKSGKDSTGDRVRLHGAIEAALSIGKKDCPVKKECILEGELLIWHEKEKRIQPFEKIRKHVTRNGRFLGNDQDSPRDLQEKVMIMFYDLLLYDDVVCLNESLDKRRSRLRSLLRRVPGQAELGYREKIDFASSDAKSMIRRAFAKGISRGWEGFVLKGCDDPYFSLAGAPRCIKLKKDYISSLGDMADLAIVGGRREPKDQQALNIGKLSWTTFYLGCLENRDEVHRFSAKPRFRIVGVVSSAKKTLSPDRTRIFNELGQFERIPYASTRAEMEVIIDQKIDPPTDLFKNPFVVEVVGGGFEKPANVTYHSLRFPRVTKNHEDRSWHDIMTFDELQEQADKAQAMATNEDSQVDRAWIDKLMQADSRSRFVNEDSACTSTGRGSCSAMNTNPIPSDHRQSMSPLLVRIDTQEMTEQERRDRKQLDGVEASSHVLPAKVTNSLKRKYEGNENSPAAKLSTKRLRFSPQQLSTVVSNPSHHDPRVDLSSCGPPRRGPLLEIENPLIVPRMPPAMVQLPPQLPSNRRRQKSRHGNSLQKKGEDIPTGSMLQPGMIPKGLAPHPMIKQTSNKIPLPTPPTSSSEESFNGIKRTVLDERSSGIHGTPLDEIGRKQNSRATGADMLKDKNQKPSTPSTNPLHAISPMVFLTTSAAMKLPGARDSFVNNICKTSHISHIAIVNRANADETAKEIKVFYGIILKQLREGKLVGKGRLLFLDLKVLPILGSDNLSTNSFAPYFGGCLAWKSGSDEIWERKWELRDIWEWDGVMDLVS